MLVYDALLDIAKTVGECYTGRSISAKNNGVLIDATPLPLPSADYLRGGCLLPKQPYYYAPASTDEKSGSQLYRTLYEVHPTTDYYDALVWMNRDVFQIRASAVVSGSLEISLGRGYAGTKTPGSNGGHSWGNRIPVIENWIAVAKLSALDLIAALHLAIEEIGPVCLVSTTSLTTVADQEEYSLPSPIRRLTRVEVATNASEPYAWTVNQYWQERNGKLFFQPGKAPADSGLKMRLWYATTDAHQAVAYTQDWALDDTLHGAFDPERLRWTAAYFAALRLAKMERNNRKENLELVAECDAKRNEMIRRYPSRMPQRDATLTGW